MLAACVGEPDGSVLGNGDLMPVFEVVTVQGDTVKSSDLQGTESVIVLFNTTCPDCQRELPQIEAQAQTEPEVRYLCIARAESPDSVVRYWYLQRLTMQVAATPDRRVYNLFARSGIPRTYRFSSTQRLISFTAP